MDNRFIRIFRKIIRNKYIQRDYKGHKVWLRNNDVDSQVYDYVFKDQYHRPYLQLKSPAPVILDLGTNIGLTVIDLKLLYPPATIYGYELDKENTTLAIKNTTGLSDVFIYNTGIWYKEELVGISGNDTDAFKISSEGQLDNELVPTTTIVNILSKHGLNRIDYIKMDIEGAEYEVFQHDTSWLDVTKQIKVEVHNGQEIFDFIRKKLDEHGFVTLKDTHHWSTIVGYKDESQDR